MNRRSFSGDRGAVAIAKHYPGLWLMTLDPLPEARDPQSLRQPRLALPCAQWRGQIVHEFDESDAYELPAVCAFDRPLKLRDHEIRSLDDLARLQCVRPESGREFWLRRVPNGPGVYFIWSRNELVYIGQSVTLRQRLESHLVNAARSERPWCKSPWTRATWLELPREALDFQEALYIASYLPRFNGRLDVSAIHGAA